MKICLLTAHRFYYVIETKHRKSTHQPFSINVPWVAVFLSANFILYPILFFCQVDKSSKSFPHCIGNYAV